MAIAFHPMAYVAVNDALDAAPQRRGWRMVAAIGMSSGRLARCCGGAAMVEFTLILPILVFLMFGIVAAGSVFYVQNNMESAAGDSARRMAVAEATFAGVDVPCEAPAAQLAGSAENIACRFRPSWATFTVNASQNCAGPNVTVRVTADASRAALMDIYGVFTGKVLTAVAVMRKEGKCP